MDTAQNTPIESVIEKKCELPKKRGRKPKPPSTEEKVLKKRGRKPKKVDNSVNVPVKEPKKRGRKPKQKIYSVLDAEKIKLSSLNDNIVLHIPVKSSDLNESVGVGGLLDYNPSINEPTPYEPTSMNNYSKLESQEKKNNENVEDGAKKVIIDTDEEEESDEDVKPCENIYNQSNNDMESILSSKVNVMNTNYVFYDANKKKEWPTSVDTHCLWCCCPFDTPPVPLPKKLIKNKFYVEGCFCSFNCAASYNFDKNFTDKWERYSLLHLLYSKTYEKPCNKIVVAPPKEVLKIFGGHMSIQEYRKNLITNEKSYKIINPPIISIIPKIEEHVITKITPTTSKFIPVNKSLVEKASMSLRIKRENEKDDSAKTLYSYMDLKIT